MIRTTSRKTPRRALITAAAVLGVSSLALAGCADVGAASSAATSASDLPQNYLDDATAFSKGLLDGGDEIGGTVTVVGTLAGAERERLLSTFAPFEAATGITVDYTGTEDYTTVVQAGVDSGNPVDVMSTTSLAMIEQYAASGDLKSLSDMIGDDTLSAEFSQGNLDATTVDGSNYGIYATLDNFMVWYNPKNYDGPTDGTWQDLSEWASTEAATGSTPWCLGLSAGATTGWPGVFMMLNQLLKQSGPEVSSGLATGATSWTSDEVKQAFEAIGAIATDDTMVAGGASGALSTEMGAAGNGMFTDPATCSLFEWGTYGAATLLSGNTGITAGEDLDFFPIPASNPDYADVEGYTGTVFAAFADRPEVAAFMKYMASTEEQTLIAATGNYVVPNVDVPTDAYPNDTLKKVSSELLTGKELVALPSATIDPSVKAALYTAFANYVQDTSTLDADLESVQAAQDAVK